MSAESTKPPVHVQPMCPTHMSYLIHHVTRTPESGPWRADVVTCNLLLFQALSADKSVQARTAGKTEDLSLILAEIGPPCCAVRDYVLAKVFNVMGKGLTHAAQVVQRKIIDPDFDMTAFSRTLKRGK